MGDFLLLSAFWYVGLLSSWSFCLIERYNIYMVELLFHFAQKSWEIKRCRSEMIKNLSFCFCRLLSSMFQVLSLIPFLRSGFLGISLVFMLLYVWSREFPNAQISIYGLVTLKVLWPGFIRRLLIGYSCTEMSVGVGLIHGIFIPILWFQAFYLPWAMLALDVIFGSPITPDLLGIIAGHLYYFLTVLHPLAGGRNILKTPMWVYPYNFSVTNRW